MDLRDFQPQGLLQSARFEWAWGMIEEKYMQ